MLNCKVAFKLVIELVPPRPEGVPNRVDTIFNLSGCHTFQTTIPFFFNIGEIQGEYLKSPLTNTKVIKQFRSMQLWIMIYSGE